MDSSDLLLTVSQLAVAFAGFSAIVVTLNNWPIREWDAADRLNLRCLLQVAIQVFAFSLLPFLLAVSLEEASVWKYGLIAYGAYIVCDASFFLFKVASDTPVVFRNAGIGGVLVGILALTTGIWGSEVSRETIYLVALFWALGIIVLSFLLLLYQVRKST